MEVHEAGKCEGSHMPTVHALHHIRSMNGHSRPHLLLCENSALYVVKFQCSQFDSRQLVSEYVASEIARFAGLPVPDHAIVNVPQALIENTPALNKSDTLNIRFFPGQHFGSRFVQRTGGSAPTDYLPEAWLTQVSNRAAFAGMFILDKWCGNCAARKAVFRQDRLFSEYAAHFIGQERCFGGAAWQFDCSMGSGFYPNCIVYHDVSNWESFEPYLSRLLSMTPDVIWQIAQQIPAEWYGDKRTELEELAARLLDRRSRVHQMVAASITSFPKQFPSWRTSPQVFLSGKSTSANAAFWANAPTIP
jgi:HipA-like kinase